MDLIEIAMNNKTKPTSFYMEITIVDYLVKDVRFPTSRGKHGSDAMNTDPDYSTAYIILKTDQKGLEGHGLTFTIGRGNEICCAALEAISHHVIGKKLSDITKDFRAFYRSISCDSQIRWLGPEKGVVHLATGAMINAVWDLYAKQEQKPLWRLLAEMSPEKLVSCIDFSYIKDVLDEQEALKILKSLEAGKHNRIDYMHKNGYPGYTTSAGWLGYSDEQIRSLCKQAVLDGWKHIKMKVGADLQDDIRRAAIIREEIGYDLDLMMDANQKWEVNEAITNMKELAKFKPLWIEEPTSPDDIIGHATIARAVAPIKVATGEHAHNRVIFKQLLQMDAIGICQIDSCRVGGVNENLAIMLMAKKFNIPVCPHAGGVGLCEYVQHLAIFDYIAISGTTEGRVIEYVDHLHEHFLDPVTIRNGKYFPPSLPGYSIEMKPLSLDTFSFPDGPAWADKDFS